MDLRGVHDDIVGVMERSFVPYTGLHPLVNHAPPGPVPPFIFSGINHMMQPRPDGIGHMLNLPQDSDRKPGIDKPPAGPGQVNSGGTSLGSNHSPTGSEGLFSSNSASNLSTSSSSSSTSPVSSSSSSQSSSEIAKRKGNV